MKNYKSLFIAICSLAILSSKSQATPVVESIGEMQIIGSFATGSVGYSGFASFTSLEAFIVSETGQGSFEYQGIQVNGTNGIVINPGYALWTGFSNGNGNWFLYLDGNATGTMLIDIIAGGSGAGTPLTGRATYVNGNLTHFDYQAHTDFQYDRNPVPDTGSTVALMVLGLSGIFAARRKLNLA